MTTYQRHVFLLPGRQIEQRHCLVQVKGIALVVLHRLAIPDGRNQAVCCLAAIEDCEGVAVAYGQPGRSLDYARFLQTRAALQRRIGIVIPMPANAFASFHRLAVADGARRQSPRQPGVEADIARGSDGDGCPPCDEYLVHHVPRTIACQGSSNPLAHKLGFRRAQLAPTAAANLAQFRRRLPA